MEIYYTDGWFRAKKRPGKRLSLSQAKAAYDQRKLYTAVIGPLAKPIAFIELNKDFIAVGFLDNLLREFMTYSFEEVQSGRLFLTMAVHREYTESTDYVKAGTTYLFKQNGNITVVTEDFLKGTKKRQETTTDVSKNWEAYPAFGDFARLLRTER